MGFLSHISAGMVHDTGEGGRAFHHGLPLVTKRSVFVTAEDERRLRRTFERGVLANILAAVLAGPFTPLWFRLAVIIPAGVILSEIVLRHMTAALPPAPAPASLFANAQAAQASAAGPKLLWAQLLFFMAFGAVCSSSLISVEDFGWRKYAGMAISAAMIAQLTYQLLLIRRTGSK